MERLPDWLKKKLPAGGDFAHTYGSIKERSLHTVCVSAKCPNIGECFSKKTATFLILGTECTRGCKFCNISKGKPTPVDKDEPKKIAGLIRKFGLKYAVITSVTRDDIPDGGASHFAEVIKELKAIPDFRVEVLTPDFNGNEASIQKVIDAKPDVFAHNVEMVKSLYKTLRPNTDYQRSIDFLKKIKEINPNMLTKSGFMLGLGETEKEVDALMDELKEAGIEILTIGQYLRPSKAHAEVKKYIHPDEFKALEKKAYKKGFKFVFSGPFVRSSYNAAAVFERD